MLSSSGKGILYCLVLLKTIWLHVHNLTCSAKGKLLSIKWSYKSFPQSTFHTAIFSLQAKHFLKLIVIVATYQLASSFPFLIFCHTRLWQWLGNAFFLTNQTKLLVVALHVQLEFILRCYFFNWLRLFWESATH